MDFTPHESLVITRLKQVRIATLTQLAAHLDLSTKTIQRALVKAGYHTSINENASYVTLEDTPQFDERGLWSYQKVHFSKYGNLRDTLAKLIEQAPAGCTLKELEQCVGTRAHNQLSQLLREGQLRRFRMGRRAVYLSGRLRQATQQEGRRTSAEPKLETGDAKAKSLASVPKGLDALRVIPVLVRLLETPDASMASVARSLQSRGVPINVDQIRHIVEFYGLKKTPR